MNLVKKILKAVGLLVLVALVAGCVVGVKHFIGEKDAPDSDIYKVSTKRDSKYNGIYTLTKLDEDGNNTWDGLICYVKNDKIVGGTIIDYVSNDELIREEFGENANINVNEDILTDLILKKITGLELGKIGGHSGFGANGVSPAMLPDGFGVYLMSFEADTTKLNLDDKDIYNTLYKSGLLAGYDEDSQEVWLSKLLSNEKSEYHEGYKLIYYANSKAADDCKIGACIRRVF